MLEIINLERKRQGLSNADIARKTGLSYLTVRSIDNGKENINYNSIRKICDCLGIEIMLKPTKF